MAQEIRIAVIGAGQIGKCHIKSILATEGAGLACIVDPSDAAKEFAKLCGADWYSNIGDMFDRARIDGAILATPSQVHVDGALVCIANGCPVLVEKPLGVSAADAEILVNAARSANVAVLTGHHRRHGAVVQRAKSIIDDGALGTVVSVQVTCWFYKPDHYFDAAWRSAPGGGPIFTNLIHDINTLLYLFGNIATVQAMISNAVRRGAVEDTAAILLRFKNGVLGTIALSDTAVSPWSWEMTSGENPAYPTTSQSCYLIGGTHASLSLPDLGLWRHRGNRDWLNPIQREHIKIGTVDPLAAQIRQFVAVIRGQQTPLVSGEDGLNTLRVVEAVKTSIATGQSVTPEI